MSGWLLAIDFGTSSTAAVVAADGKTEVVEIGGAARIPSVVAALDDDTLVAGDAAVRQLTLAPERTERAPKRRLGDRAVLLGERAVAPTALVAAVLRLVADEASRRRGGTAPDAVRLTHPASWASTRLEALRAAAAQAGLPEPELLPEPVAAALHLSDERLAVGDHVAVYDLGGGTFDAAVLRRTEDGFVLVGPPGGNDRVGGEDLDEKLLEHVGTSIREQDAESWERLRFSDERAWRRAAAALRGEVRAAKEALSSAPHATVYVPAPVDLEVRVTREELETIVRPDLERTVDELLATVERAGLQLSQLAAVYLVGGGSRMPLVGRLVADRTGITPTTWGDPKASVALGAAIAPAAAVLPVDEQPTGVLPLPIATAPVPEPRQQPAPVPAAPQAPAEPASAPALLPFSPAAPARSRRRVVALAAAATLVLAAAGTAVLVGGGGDQKKSEKTTVELPAYAFAEASDRTVRSERTWSLDAAGTTLTNSTVLTNSSAAPITRTAIEVVPKEVATTVADVRFDTGFTVVQDDPVVRYQVVLAPGASRTLRWTRDLPQAADADRLTELAGAQRKAEQALAPNLARLLPAGLLAAAPAVPFPGAKAPDPGATTSASPTATPTPVATTAGPTPTRSALPVVQTTRPVVTQAPPVVANRAPSVGAITSKTYDELQAVSVTLPGSDPDGDALSYTASGLPSGLKVSGNRITGTLSYAAASVTTDQRQGIKSKGFTVTVTARDSKGATGKRSFALTVRDTHRTMPNYIGNCGCNEAGLPDIAAISTPNNDCSKTDGTVGDSTIWRQGVAPGAVIRYGQSINYWYRNDAANCQTEVPKGW